MYEILKISGIRYLNRVKNYFSQIVAPETSSLFRNKLYLIWPWIGSVYKKLHLIHCEPTKTLTDPIQVSGTRNFRVLAHVYLREIDVTRSKQCKPNSTRQLWVVMFNHLPAFVVYTRQSKTLFRCSWRVYLSCKIKNLPFTTETPNWWKG